MLSHSRKAYSEVVYRQTTDDFLGCIENAFRHFGGAPRRLILDNLRAAVKNADWFDPELNPKVRSFGEYYGSVFWPTRPYTPRHKGKVEKGIDYVQDNALKGRRFASLQEQNAFLRDWELTVADTRIHGTTRRQVGKHFAEVERAALVPLPLAPFPSYQESRRTVHRDGHVEVERAYYAVPPEYLAREVWVRWDARLVRIFNQRMEPIVVHTRKEPGRFSTPPELIAPEKISGVERGAGVALGQGEEPAGPPQYHLGRGDDRGPRRRGGARAPGSLEPRRTPSHRGDRGCLQDRRRLRRLSPQDNPSAASRARHRNKNCSNS